jgi:DNA-binding IclR family transcriptional regulator
VIQSLLKPKKFPPQPFEVSENEVIHGIASIAVPLHLSSGQPAAIAVLYIPHKVNVAKVAKALTAAANRICAVMG